MLIGNSRRPAIDKGRKLPRGAGKTASAKYTSMIFPSLSLGGENVLPLLVLLGDFVSRRSLFKVKKKSTQPRVLCIRCLGTRCLLWSIPFREGSGGGFLGKWRCAVVLWGSAFPVSGNRARSPHRRRRRRWFFLGVRRPLRIVPEPRCVPSRVPRNASRARLRGQILRTSIISFDVSVFSPPSIHAGSVWFPV